MAFKVHYFKTQEAILRVLDQADTKASSDRFTKLGLIKDNDSAKMPFRIAISSITKPTILEK